MNNQPVDQDDAKHTPEVSINGTWSRVGPVLARYRPAAWLVFLTTSLILFLVWMPPQIRFLVWSALAARGILSIMLLVFSLLAISLVWSVGQRIDVWAFLFFNLYGPHPLWLDRLMLGFTQIGNGIFALAVGLVVFLTGSRMLAYELILGTLTLWIVVELVKALVRRSRPFIRISQARVVGSRALGLSFPSGHTSQAFFMAALVAPHFHAIAWVILLVYGIAMLVGITRIYLGAHYPRDVLAGAILGSAWGLMGVLVDGYMLNGPG